MADYMNAKETGAELRISENTLAYWRHIGKGPNWGKIGRRIFYRREDVLAWRDAQFERAGGGA